MGKKVNAIRKIRLLYDTVRQLRVIQIKGQIKRKIKRGRVEKYDRLPRLSGIESVHIGISELDEDKEYVSRYNIEILLSGQIEILHERHCFTEEWYEPKASHLWNYNLHYLEFTVPLAVKYKQTGEQKYKEKWIEIVTSWLENGSQSSDACQPYTISLRIPNILIGLELIGEIEKRIKRQLFASIYNQYKFLQENVEIALLANHYFENLKTIVITSILFCEFDVYQKYFNLLLQQIDEQILADGLHYERSLSYHKIILEDILRVYVVLKNFYRPDAEKLKPSIKLMAEALWGIEVGFCQTPLFNDSGDNVSKPAITLLKVCKKITGDISQKTDFPYAGYYRFDHGNKSVLFDCGDIGPSYMGGHGHNDCLSFELSVGGKKVFTNSGTGQYQGELRAFFRSTPAHSTVIVDLREQSELWGEHRIARRADHFKVERSGDALRGQFCSYQGDRYRRQLQWKENKLIITDDVKSKGIHIARQFFHIVPGLRYERDKNRIRVFEGEKMIAIITPSKRSDYLIYTEGQITNYAADFGKYERKQVLEIRTPFLDKDRIRVEIEVNG